MSAEVPKDENKDTPMPNDKGEVLSQQEIDDLLAKLETGGGERDILSDDVLKGAVEQGSAALKVEQQAEPEAPQLGTSPEAEQPGFGEISIRFDEALTKADRAYTRFEWVKGNQAGSAQALNELMSQLSSAADALFTELSAQPDSGAKEAVIATISRARAEVQYLFNLAEVVQAKPVGVVQAGELIEAPPGPEQPRPETKKQPKPDSKASALKLLAELGREAELPELALDWKPAEGAASARAVLSPEAEQALKQFFSDHYKADPKELMQEVAGELEKRFTDSIVTQSQIEYSKVSKHHKKKFGVMLGGGVVIGGTVMGLRALTTVTGGTAWLAAKGGKLAAASIGGAMFGGLGGYAMEKLKPRLEKLTSGKAAGGAELELAKVLKAQKNKIAKSESVSLVAMQLIMERLAVLAAKPEATQAQDRAAMSELITQQAPELSKSEAERERLARMLVALNRVSEKTESKLAKFMALPEGDPKANEKLYLTKRGIKNGVFMGSGIAVGNEVMTWAGATGEALDVVPILGGGVMGAKFYGGTISSWFKRKGIEARYKEMEKAVIPVPAAEAPAAKRVAEVAAYLTSGLLDRDPALKTKAQQFVVQAEAEGISVTAEQLAEQVGKLELQLTKQERVHKRKGYTFGFLGGVALGSIGTRLSHLFFDTVSRTGGTEKSWFDKFTEEKQIGEAGTGADKGVSPFDTAKTHAPAAPPSEMPGPVKATPTGAPAHQPTEVPAPVKATPTGTPITFEKRGEPVGTIHLDKAGQPLPPEGAPGKAAGAIEVEIKGKIDTFSEAIAKAVHQAPVATQDNFIHRVLGNSQEITDATRTNLLQHSVAKLSVSNLGEQFGKGIDVENLLYKGNQVVLNPDGSWDVVKGAGAHEAQAVSEEALRANAAKLRATPAAAPEHGPELSKAGRPANWLDNLEAKGYGVHESAPQGFDFHGKTDVAVYSVDVNGDGAPDNYIMVDTATGEPFEGDDSSLGAVHESGKAAADAQAAYDLYVKTAEQVPAVPATEHWSTGQRYHVADFHAGLDKSLGTKPELTAVVEHLGAKAPQLLGDGDFEAYATTHLTELKPDSAEALYAKGQEFMKQCSLKGVDYDLLQRRYVRDGVLFEVRREGDKLAFHLTNNVQEIPSPLTGRTCQVPFQAGETFNQETLVSYSRAVGSQYVAEQKLYDVVHKLALNSTDDVLKLHCGSVSEATLGERLGQGSSVSQELYQELVRLIGKGNEAALAHQGSKTVGEALAEAAARIRGSNVADISAELGTKATAPLEAPQPKPSAQPVAEAPVAKGKTVEFSAEFMQHRAAFNQRLREFIAPWGTNDAKLTQTAEGLKVSPSELKEILGDLSKSKDLVGELPQYVAANPAKGTVVRSALELIHESAQQARNAELLKLIEELQRVVG